MHVWDGEDCDWLSAAARTNGPHPRPELFGKLQKDRKRPSRRGMRCQKDEHNETSATIYTVVHIVMGLPTN